MDNLINELKTIYQNIILLNLKPSPKYINYYKSSYSKYTIEELDDKKIEDRYLIEVTLILFFKKILYVINPKLDINIDLIDEYYHIPEEINFNLDFNFTIENILELYLLTTKSILSKNNKYFCEFYTPNNISHNMITSIETKFLKDKKHSYLDPSCGVGTLLGSLFIQYIKKSKPTSSEILFFLNKQLFGYDILPFSVILTKLQLISIHQLYTKNKDFSDIPNILLKDGLYDFSEKKFSCIIANPPYKKTFNNHELVNKYKEYLHGHPNLYLLFLLWSLDKVEDKGIILFLLPQTIRVGSHNDKFRRLIKNRYFLDKIILFYQRTNIFSDVEQKVMIIKLLKNKKKAKVGIELNYLDNKKLKSFKVAYDDFLYKSKSTFFWSIPHSVEGHEITRIIKNLTLPLEEFNFFKIGNGTYVWNQNKESLSNLKTSEFKIPLIYSNSISFKGLKFPISFNNESKGIYSKILAKNIKIWDDELILIKRTINGENKNRLNACYLEIDFIKKYGGVYLENHVNYIYIDNENKKLKIAITYWLNSKLLNYYFNTVSATSHVSLYEIKALPFNLELINTLEDILDKNDNELVEKIDRQIYKYFNLNNNQIKEIEDFFR